MKRIMWPEKFPQNDDMFELLQKMSKASWCNNNEFTLDDIKCWLSNFTGEIFNVEDERKLALWLLCNFTYYNKDEINHLCKIVYKELLHDLAINNTEYDKEKFDHIFDNVYFAAIGKVSESGGLLSYFFRQQSQMSINKFFFLTNLPKDEQGIIVFIDDVTLSGSTGMRFFNNNLKKLVYKKAYYLTLFASQKAIDGISSNNITMIQSTVLGERERCFSKESLIFADFPDLLDASKRLALNYGKKLSPKNPLGYKNGQYYFGLYYNTPNNTLPIFWSSNNWNPIFLRKEKSYNDWRRIEYDRFI